MCYMCFCYLVKYSVYLYFNLPTRVYACEDVFLVIKQTCKFSYVIIKLGLVLLHSHNFNKLTYSLVSQKQGQIFH